MLYFLNKLWALRDFHIFYNSFALDFLEMLNLKIKYIGYYCIFLKKNTAIDI